MEQSLYEQIGGEETLQKLVEAFYPRVYAHPDLKPIFQEDMQIIMHKQKLLLTQFLGGPPVYRETYGPPDLRRRHSPFEITPKRAKAWLECMKEAMDEIGLEGPLRELFYSRLTQVAYRMVNTEDPS